MDDLITCPHCGHVFNPFESVLVTELHKLARDFGGAFRMNDVAYHLGIDRKTARRKLRPLFDHKVLQRDSPKSIIRFAKAA